MRTGPQMKNMRIVSKSTASVACALTFLIAWAPEASAIPPASQLNFGVKTLFPTYSPNASDYSVRCANSPVVVHVHGQSGWQVAVNGGAFRTGDYNQTVPLQANRAFGVKVRKVGQTATTDFHVRCLPANFPTYSYSRSGPAYPRFVSVDRDHVGDTNQFAIVFDDHGAPIWWINDLIHAPRVLPGGRLLWFDTHPGVGQWGIHRLDGPLLRVLDPVGHSSDDHDNLPVSNGTDYTGSYVQHCCEDLSAYGGPTSAAVVTVELQQVGRNGALLWDWKGRDHISLDETGRHWPMVLAKPRPSGGYDVEHWNSIALDGPDVIASFRQLDAVYKIDKATGNIIWKLGGTHTPQSLTVVGDPNPSYPFSSQHYARIQPDGTLTVFDNHTGLGAPRAVRYRIDQTTGTATLLESISDPEVPDSRCCGSAKRLANGDWLIDWGGLDPPNGDPIGGYRSDGTRTFLLSMDDHYSYRAEAVPSTVSGADFRQAMNAMYGG